MIHVPVHWWWRPPIHLAEKLPQTIVFPSLYLMMGMVFFEPWWTWHIQLMPKSWLLVSSGRRTFSQAFTETFRGSLENWTDLGTWVFFSSGTFSLSQYGISSVFTDSSGVVKSGSLSLLNIIYNPCGKSYMKLWTQDKWQPFLWIMAPTVSPQLLADRLWSTPGLYR